MKRRTFLGGFAASALVSGTASLSWSQTAAKRLSMPPLIDATKSHRVRLEAQKGGRSTFSGPSPPADTWGGFNQPFLGPTLRMKTGQITQIEVRNSLDEPISVHWHGLLIHGEVDGGGRISRLHRARHGSRNCPP